MRRKIIRLRVRKKYVTLYLLQIMIRQILRIRFNLFGAFEVDICVGALNDKIKNQ